MFVSLNQQKVVEREWKITLIKTHKNKIKYFKSKEEKSRIIKCTFTWYFDWFVDAAQRQRGTKSRRKELKAAPLSLSPALTNNKHAITSPMKKRRLTKKRTCKLCLPKTWSKGAITGDKWTEARQTPAREMGVPPLAITNTLFFVIYCCLSEISLSLSPISISTSPSRPDAQSASILDSPALSRLQSCWESTAWRSLAACRKQAGFFLFLLSVDNCRLQIAWLGKKRVDFPIFNPVQSTSSALTNAAANFRAFSFSKGQMVAVHHFWNHLLLVS